jgi:hypothetical protein
MTMIDERRQTTPVPAMRAAVDHTVEWAIGALGALAALIGGWMYYGPSDGTISVFAWDWDVTDLAEGWPLGLMVGGGVLLAAAFAGFAFKVFRRHDRVTGSVAVGGLLSLAALAGAVVYLLIWIF